MWRKNILFLIFLLAGMLIYGQHLITLAKLSFNNALYSHFLLIPIVSIYFIYLHRKKVFSDLSYSLYIGITMVIAGLALYWIGISNEKSLSQNDFLSLCALGAVAWLNGGFVIFYGIRAFQQALFPLMFLMFMIPIPLFILDPLIRFFQVYSAHAVHGVFEIIGIPYLRTGLVFELPGIAIEVAKECSGIRSSLALFITTVMAGYMFLNTGKRRVILAMSIIPITIFKNALRITTLALMASYVDPAWITDSWLHKAGGKPFFVLGLCLLLPIVWLLRRSEKKSLNHGEIEGTENRKVLSNQEAARG